MNRARSSEKEGGWGLALASSLSSSSSSSSVCLSEVASVRSVVPSAQEKGSNWVINKKEESISFGLRAQKREREKRGAFLGDNNSCYTAT